ncbi:hypothetical protein ACFYT4_07640 [Streptomyces sp. NPDC004609]|uniref:hypothetical protein n=1 Tax=Streptomyces sp. NPDC004609 TaxID=3364704 RepID=UPI0036A21EFC
MRRPDPLTRTGGPAGERGAASRPGADPDDPRPGLVHGFRPGKVVAGAAVLTAALLYAGDAAGAWRIPWFVAFPVVFGGLFLAAVVSVADYGIRRRRSAIQASRESIGAPASTSGSQAIR